VRYRFPIFLTLSMMISLVSRAQRFGGNPPSMKWKQMESSTARVIYPDNRKKDAHRVLQVMAKMSQDSIGGLGNQTRKIPIVLQTLPLVSNGYVGLAPWRSEFYMTPLQNGLELGSTNWTDNLASQMPHPFQIGSLKGMLSTPKQNTWNREGEDCPIFLTVITLFGMLKKNTVSKN